MMKPIQKVLFSLFLTTTLTPVSAAFSAKDANTTAEIETLKKQVDNANTKLADALNQLISLRQEIASLKGNTESGSFFRDEQVKTLRDYDQRIAALEDKINTIMSLLDERKTAASNTAQNPTNTAEIPTTPTAEPTTAAPTAPTPNITGQENGGAKVDEVQTREFQRLLTLVQGSEYAQAVTGFEAFIQKNPKSPLVENAQYWLGESYYNLNEFKKAIGAYQTLVQKYPQSGKLKSALLRQGLSFLGLQMPNEAKPFFEKVVLDYPQSSEAAQASAKLKEINKTQVTPGGAQPAAEKQKQKRPSPSHPTP